MTHSIQATHYELRTTYHVQITYPTSHNPLPIPYSLPTTHHVLRITHLLLDSANMSPDKHIRDTPTYKNKGDRH